MNRVAKDLVNVRNTPCVASFEFGKISIVNELNDLAGNQIASYVVSETLPRTISRGSTVFSIMWDENESMW